MSNTVIFYTQVGSILLFVFSLFILYRLLVQQKDATIELLREKNQWLKEQLEISAQSKPDVLLEIKERRLQLTETELTRLNEDYGKNAALIVEKENEREALL